MLEIVIAGEKVGCGVPDEEACVYEDGYPAEIASGILTVRQSGTDLMLVRFRTEYIQRYGLPTAPAVSCGEVAMTIDANLLVGLRIGFGAGAGFIVTSAIGAMIYRFECRKRAMKRGGYAAVEQE